jgi:iron complex transport system ATP-binding protein
VHVDGKAASSYSSRQLAGILSMVRQEFVPVFGFSVRQTVMMARYYRTSSLFENPEDIKAVDAALSATDTADFADRPLGHLSGGERQRVFIARALAQETPVLLLDEPTSHLDLKHQIRIFDLLKQMQCEQGKTILLVTHDLNLAAQYCDKVLLLGPGGAFFQGPPEDVLDSGQIQSTFGVKGYRGQIKKRKFFIPLGRFSKDRPGNNA